MRQLSSRALASTTPVPLLDNLPGESKPRKSLKDKAEARRIKRNLNRRRQALPPTSPEDKGKKPEVLAQIHYLDARRDAIQTEPCPYEDEFLKGLADITELDIALIAGCPPEVLANLILTANGDDDLVLPPDEVDVDPFEHLRREDDTGYRPDHSVPCTAELLAAEIIKGFRNLLTPADVYDPEFAGDYRETVLEKYGMHSADRP